MHAYVYAELPCGYPQETLTERALELLALPQDGAPKLLLDLGCGSGLSGESLTNHGHTWVVSCCETSFRKCVSRYASSARPHLTS